MIGIRGRFHNRYLDRLLRICELYHVRNCGISNTNMILCNVFLKGSEQRIR